MILFKGMIDSASYRFFSQTEEISVDVSAIIKGKYEVVTLIQEVVNLAPNVRPSNS